MLHFTDQESHEGDRPKERHPIPAIKNEKNNFKKQFSVLLKSLGKYSKTITGIGSKPGNITTVNNSLMQSANK
jgi:hypothetical protein